MFILGAYPSALHVHWYPPGGGPPGAAVSALPVDNEPTPFWDGNDANERVAAWCAAVGYDPEATGIVHSARTNGSSGRALDRSYLAPLGLQREDCWITDCLSTYRTSVQGRKAMQARFDPFATERGLAGWDLPPHPDEKAIVQEALAKQRQRLLDELKTCRPELIVTLGAAAAAVLADLVKADGPSDGLQVARYGRRSGIAVGRRRASWLPLIHPGLITRRGRGGARWREQHGRWARLEHHRRAVGGRLYRRVDLTPPSDAWPPGTPPHFIDGVLFPSHPADETVEWADDVEGFRTDICRHDAVLLTAGGYHDRTLLGTLVGGRELLSRSHPSHEQLDCAALVDFIDPNMAWVYRRNGIELVHGKGAWC